jgi:hypothetical protein
MVVELARTLLAARMLLAALSPLVRALPTARMLSSALSLVARIRTGHFVGRV